MNSAISSDRRFRARQLLPGNTEHVHDDERRQRSGELGDEVEFVAFPQAIEQPPVDRFDLAAQGMDRGR